MKIALCVVLTGLLLTGCQTYQQQQSTRMHQREDALLNQENQRRMAGRIETQEMEIARISRDFENMQRQLNSRISALEQKMESDKREMVARLSGKLEKLVKQSAPPRAAAPSGGSAGGSEYGFEHIVQKGETISTIAKAYNVTPKVIIQANKIKNPALIRIGQKLFIPE